MSAMTKALLRFKREKGHAAMRTLLQEVAGVNAMSDVSDEHIDDVIAACESDHDFTKSGAKAKANPKADFHSKAFVDHCFSRFNSGGSAS